MIKIIDINDFSSEEEYWKAFGEQEEAIDEILQDINNPNTSKNIKFQPEIMFDFNMETDV